MIRPEEFSFLLFPSQIDDYAHLFPLLVAEIVALCAYFFLRLVVGQLSFFLGRVVTLNSFLPPFLLSARS